MNPLFYVYSNCYSSFLDNQWVFINYNIFLNYYLNSNIICIILKLEYQASLHILNIFCLFFIQIKEHINNKIAINRGLEIVLTLIIAIINIFCLNLIYDLTPYFLIIKAILNNVFTIYKI